MTMREARALSALDGLTDGDHVGWVVEHSAEFTQMAAEYLRQGAAARQKLFFFSPRRVDRPRSLPIGDGVSVLDPRLAFLSGGALDASAMYAGLEREAAKAVDEGYRGLRVMADMDWLLGTRPSGGRIAAFEQGLDALAARTGVTIVCAYRRDSFPRRELAGVMCMHPHRLGGAPQDLGFRIWSSGEGRWHLSGQVDLRAAEAFPAALRTAAAERTSLWLDFTQLGFIDIAGIRALAQVAHSTGVSVQVYGASEALKRCWKLLDWDSAVMSVEFCA
jgi:anti-anti-sigma regulatory factor